jgi:hypothetical protein
METGGSIDFGISINNCFQVEASVGYRRRIHLPARSFLQIDLVSREFLTSNKLQPYSTRHSSLSGTQYQVLSSATVIQQKKTQGLQQLG